MPLTAPRRVYHGVWALLALAGLGVTACASAGITPSAGVDATPADVDATPTSANTSIERLLDLSEIESIIAARATAFTRQVALMAEDLTDAELERLVPAVQEGFDRELLRRDVADAMLAEAPEGRIEEVLAWLDAGASGEVRTRAEAYDPPMELGPWLETYTDEPPSPDRVRLMARWSESRGEGTFFLLLEQALEEAAHATWAEFRPLAPGFVPLSGDELLARLESSTMAAVVTALHSHEPISDDLIRSSALEYESEAGQWYVETYQLAIAEAIRTAGERVVETLRAQGR